MWILQGYFLQDLQINCRGFLRNIFARTCMEIFINILSRTLELVNVDFKRVPSQGPFGSINVKFWTISSQGAPCQKMWWIFLWNLQVNYRGFLRNIFANILRPTNMDLFLTTISPNNLNFKDTFLGTFRLLNINWF